MKLIGSRHDSLPTRLFTSGTLLLKESTISVQTCVCIFFPASLVIKFPGPVPVSKSTRSLGRRPLTYSVKAVVLDHLPFPFSSSVVAHTYDHPPYLVGLLKSRSKILQCDCLNKALARQIPRQVRLACARAYDRDENLIFSEGSKLLRDEHGEQFRSRVLQKRDSISHPC